MGHDLVDIVRDGECHARQRRVKCAFGPTQILNPGKVFPKLHRCAELGRMHVHKGEVKFPDLPRF